MLFIGAGNACVRMLSLRDDQGDDRGIAEWVIEFWGVETLRSGKAQC